MGLVVICIKFDSNYETILSIRKKKRRYLIVAGSIPGDEITRTFCLRVLVIAHAVVRTGRKRSLTTAAVQACAMSSIN